MFRIALWNLERTACKSAAIRAKQNALLLSQDADLLILTEVDRTLALDGYAGCFSDPAPAGVGYSEAEAAVGILHRWVEVSPRRVPIEEHGNLALCMSFANSPLSDAFFKNGCCERERERKRKRVYE